MNGGETVVLEGCRASTTACGDVRESTIKIAAKAAGKACALAKRNVGTEGLMSPLAA